MAIAINFQPFFQPISSPPPTVSPTPTTLLPPTIPTKPSSPPKTAVVPTPTVTLTPIKDYDKLKRFLSEKKWKEADEETNNLTPKILECMDLKIINLLWDENSDGKFGYRVQREIWEKSKNYDDFAKSVGWLREYNDEKIPKKVYFDIPVISPDAPKGHLPFSLWQINQWFYRDGLGDFMKKLSDCKI